MAILNQDFIKFDGDQVVLKFTVTDNVNITNYRAWFGLSSATSYATLSSADLIEKHTGTPASESWLQGTGCTGTAIPSTYYGIDVSSDHLFIFIGYSDFEDGTSGNTLFPYNAGFGGNGNYYYELVMSETGDQCSSTVSAQGFLDLRQALFNSQEYRGAY